MTQLKIMKGLIKMNSLKKFTAILLAAVTIASVPAVCYADEEAQTAEQVVETTTKKRFSILDLFKKKETTTAATEEETTQASKASANSKAVEEVTEESTTKKKRTSIFQNVATMYFLISNANPEKPHTWIYIENLTDESLQVGHYTLPPYETMSVGAFMDRGNGYGVYYNLERYWVKEETYERTYYLKTKVSRAELKTVTTTINNHDYWNWVFNCCWFATCVWNKCTPLQLIHLGWPQVTRVQIRCLGAKHPDFEIKKLTDTNKVYKHTEDGLEVVYPGVLYTKTGV